MPIPLRPGLIRPEQAGAAPERSASTWLSPGRHHRMTARAAASGRPYAPPALSASDMAARSCGRPARSPGVSITVTDGITKDGTGGDGPVETQTGVGDADSDGGDIYEPDRWS